MPKLGKRLRQLKKKYPRTYRRARGIKTSIRGVSKKELNAKAQRIVREETDQYYKEYKREKKRFRGAEPSDEFVARASNEMMQRIEQRALDYSSFRSVRDAMDALGIARSRIEISELSNMFIERGYFYFLESRGNTNLRKDSLVVSRIEEKKFRKDSIVARNIKKIDRLLGRTRGKLFRFLLVENFNRIQINLWEKIMKILDSYRQH